MTLNDFNHAVEQYLFATGASVTSGWRTQHHHRALGGVDHSPHLVGLAVDVIYDPNGNSASRAGLAARLGLLLVVEDDHDHLQPADWAGG